MSRRSGCRGSIAARTWPRRVRPHIVCRTFGVADFIRRPWPAASTITAAGRASVTVSLPDQRPGKTAYPGGVERGPYGVAAPGQGLEPRSQGTKSLRHAVRPPGMDLNRKVMPPGHGTLGLDP